MTTIESETWPSVYEGLFLYGGELSEHRIEDMETEINHVLNYALTEPEMVAACREIARKRVHGDGSNKIPPNSVDIARVIVALRTARKQSGYGKHKLIVRVHDRVEYFYQDQWEWQKELRDAANPTERWNVICRPCDDSDCASRKAFCEMNGLEFDVFHPTTSNYENLVTIR